MIFSKKIYKLVSGKNLTLYAEDDSSLEVFVFEKCVNKYLVDLQNFVKSNLVTKNLAYNQIEKLNDTNSVVRHGDNISIVDNENENL